MWSYNYTDELYHHGVKGMKWGVRRFQNKNGGLTPAGKKRYAAELDDKKAAYKTAKDVRTKAIVNTRVANQRYNDAFNRAYKYSNANAISQYVSKNKKAMSNALWDEANKSKSDYLNARTASKQARKDYRQARQEYGKAKTNARFEKYDLDPTNPTHIMDVSHYGYRGAQRIQKRMDSKHISNFKSSMIESGRNFAVGSLTLIGGAMIAGAVSKYSNPTAKVLDASGKVIKRIYS